MVLDWQSLVARLGTDLLRHTDRPLCLLNEVCGAVVVAVVAGKPKLPLLELTSFLSFHTSWGWPSDSMCGGQNPGNCSGGITSEQYSTRVDAEFMKIAARGVTLVGASGDQGAPGDDHYTCSPGLSDILPASSLWVTAVGATQLGKKALAGVDHPATAQLRRAARAQPFGAPICKSFTHPFEPKCADGTNTYEVVCSYANDALITSGGGFQDYFPMPTWQQAAVQSYLNNPAAKVLP